MRFRRKASEEAGDGPLAEDLGVEQPPQPGDAAAGVRADGPWDASEVDLHDESVPRLDLGSLVVAPPEGVEVRLHVDEQAGHVSSVLLVAPDGAVELRAFAAPRNEDLWQDVRRQIAADAVRHGGTATEVDGPYGPALDIRISGQTPDGQSFVQQSRVLGISGPRWLLRATLLGRPAVEFQRDGLVESALRSTVVVRGSGPMVPGELLPLTMPPGAEPTPG